MIVAFTSPVHGQAGTTTNLEAAATMLAMDFHLRMVMTHTHRELSTLERAYAKLLEGDLFKETGGIDAIDRLAKCAMLSPESIRDNALSIIKDRLDIIPGTDNPSTDLDLTIHNVLDMYKKMYQLMFIDVSSTRDVLSKSVMERADLIVVNLNQNRTVLDSFFGDKDWMSLVNGKKVLYCLGAFDRTSRLTKDRIAKEYRISTKDMFTVPYNVRYRDAQNDKHIIDYLMKARTVEKRRFEFNEEVFFVEHVRLLGNAILKTLELMPIKEQEELYA